MAIGSWPERQALFDVALLVERGDRKDLNGVLAIGPLLKFFPSQELGGLTMA